MSADRDDGLDDGPDLGGGRGSPRTVTMRELMAERDERRAADEDAETEL